MSAEIGLERAMARCGLCDAEEARPYRQIGQWRLVKCRRCGLVYLSPRPSIAMLPRLYEEDYYRTRDLQADHSPETIRREVDIRMPSAERLTREVGGVGRWLDIGCASGYLIAAARAVGWQVAGVEISQWSSDYARQEFGLDVFTGTLAEYADGVPAGRFDLITAMAYLEHSPFPLEDMKSMERLLSGQGTVVIRVPNLASFDRVWHGDKWRGWEVPRHLFHFTPRTLGNLARKGGLHVDRVELDFWNPSVHLREVRRGDGWRADHPREGRAFVVGVDPGESGNRIARWFRQTTKMALTPLLSGRDMTLYARK